MDFNVVELVPMQDGFRRSKAALRQMLDFAGNGGIYDPETLSNRDSGRTTPIILNKFEDGKVYIHDGLHRAAAIFAGREKRLIYEDEYTLLSLSYNSYQEINVAADYVTPFDPRREVRIADFHGFKDRVRDLVKESVDPTPFIKDNRHLYVRPRQPHHATLETMLRFFHPGLLGD